jgi:hypothetical protein
MLAPLGLIRHPSQQARGELAASLGGSAIDALLEWDVDEIDDAVEALLRHRIANLKMGTGNPSRRNFVLIRSIIEDCEPDEPRCSVEPEGPPARLIVLTARAPAIALTPA